MLDELRLDRFTFELEELDTLDFELALELDRLDFELMELVLELDTLDFELIELGLELDELNFELDELELDIVLKELLDTSFEIAELLLEETLLAALLLETDGLPGAASPAGSMLDEVELAMLDRLWFALLTCVVRLVRALDTETLLRLCNDDAGATLSPPVCGVLFAVRDDPGVVPTLEDAASLPAPPPQALSIMHNEVVADI